jgi:hypothetical protein
MADLTKATTKLSKQPRLAGQRRMILWPFVDALENGGIDELFAYLRHVGVCLAYVDTKTPDLQAAILLHYQVGAKRYDIERAARDVATYPRIARRIEELRSKRQVPNDFGTADNA